MSFNEWAGWRGSAAEFMASWIQLLAGLLLSAMGWTLMLRSQFGMGPWGVFQVALAQHIDISLGFSIQAVGAILLIASFVMARLVPTAGTLANMYLVGVFVDQVWNPYFPEINGFALRFGASILSILIFAVGGAVYLSANHGPGPRDGLMMAIYMRNKISLRRVRSVIEFSVLIVGWLLGGPIGIGTLMFAFLVGPILQYSLEILPRLPIRLDRTTILKGRNGQFPDGQ